MRKKILDAFHEGVIEIGNISISCAVLEDGTRVLNQSKFLLAIGRSRTPTGRSRGVEELPPFLEAKNLQPFIQAELTVSPNRIKYRSVKTGNIVYGYQATLLSDVCEVYLKAREQGKLLASQLHIANACDILSRGFRKLGIIALVDEQTGFQEDRIQNALAKILEAFLAKELLSWAKRFGDDFYRELFRLRGWRYSQLSNKRPPLVGKITNDIVYARLAPGVLDELRQRTPRDEKGRLRKHLHRWLTEDIGHPALRAHLEVVIALMKVSNSWDAFMRRLNKVKPQCNKTMLLFDDDVDDDDTPKLALPGVSPKAALKAAMEVDPNKVKKRMKKGGK